MIYSFLADLLVLFHLVFILYVMAGALLILKWTKKKITLGKMGLTRSKLLVAASCQLK